jgi:hypothetical protein
MFNNAYRMLSGDVRLRQGVGQISSTMAVSMSNNMLNKKMTTIEDLVEANEVYDSFPANIWFIFSCN